MKVLQLLHPELVEGTIARYCDALKGTIEGGLQHLFSPQGGFSPSSIQSTFMVSRTLIEMCAIGLEIRLVDFKSSWLKTTGQSSILGAPTCIVPNCG